MRYALAIAAALLLVACGDQSDPDVDGRSLAEGEPCVSGGPSCGTPPHACIQWSHVHAAGWHCYLKCKSAQTPEENGCTRCDPIDDVDNDRRWGVCYPHAIGVGNSCVAELDCVEGASCVDGVCVAN